MTHDSFLRCSIVICARPTPPKQVRQLRRKFNSKRKHHLLPQIPKNCEWHHIVPLSLGGSNSESNMVPCEKNLHKEIHTFINSQGLVKRPSKILIPIINSKIWGCVP